MHQNENDKDRSGVLVMNENTWEDMKKKLMQEASNHDDPIAVLNKYNGVPVHIDNTLRNNVVEIYEAWAWEVMREMRRREREERESE